METERQMFTGLGWAGLGWTWQGLAALGKGQFIQAWE